MAKNVDSPEIALTRLRALRAEKPATQMGQIRWAWSEISAALARGHSLTTVHQRLQEVGIQIPYKRLSLYIGRLRREYTKRPAAPLTALDGSAVPVQTPIPIPGPALPSPASIPAILTDSHPQHPVARDPLANLRKFANTRPGFQWDEAPPDKDKLF